MPCSRDHTRCQGYMPGCQEEGARALGDVVCMLLGMGAGAQGVLGGEGQLGQLGGVQGLITAGAAVLAVPALLGAVQADAQPAVACPARTPDFSAMLRTTSRFSDSDKY